MFQMITEFKKKKSYQNLLANFKALDLMGNYHFSSVEPLISYL